MTLNPTLNTLANTHAGKLAVIVGTGPSATKDALLMIPDDAVRIAINRAVGTIPVVDGLTYWMVIDDAWSRDDAAGEWTTWLMRVMTGDARITGVFREKLLAGTGYTRAPESEHIVVFDTPSGDARQVLDWPRETLCAQNMLYQFCGTAGAATHLAWLMGCDRYAFLGVDGDTLEYARIRENAFLAARACGMELTDF